MSNHYMKKMISTSIALTIMMGTSLALQPQGLAYADSSNLQLHKRQLTDSFQAHKKAKQQKAFPIFEEAAKIIGINTDELIKAVESGKSIAEVAKEKGISEKKLTSQLLSIRSAKVDEAVKAGKLTKQSAKQIKAKLAEHLKFMLNKKGLSSKQHWVKHKKMPISPDQLAAIVGISRDELITQLKSGHSLSEIAQTKGISREQLIMKIKEQLTPYIEKKIDYKHKPNREKNDS